MPSNASGYSIISRSLIHRLAGAAQPTTAQDTNMGHISHGLLTIGSLSPLSPENPLFVLLFCLFLVKLDRRGGRT